MAALIERVIGQFVREHSDNSPALLEATTKADRLKLIRDTLQYVLAVESVAVSQVEQADLMRRAYSELFAYGPLDALLEDESITTISLEGIDKVSVRYGHEEVVSIAPLFDDYDQYHRLVARMIRNAGAQMRPDIPYIETGLVIEGRRVCVTLFTPPAVMELTVVLRLHPRVLPTLDSITPDEAAQQLIEAIALSPHGVVIVGEVESGKTTLLALIARRADLRNAASVERASELSLPESVRRLAVQWSVDDEGGASFAQQIRAALAQSPALLLLDEVRADEAGALDPLLAASSAPRLLWTFRGTTDSKRLASSLGMVARMGSAGTSESRVKALYERSPFVLAVKRRNHRLELQAIAEWQFSPDSEYPTLVELMAMGWDGIARTGKRPQRALDLPDDFWG
jgi:pilus assembly protein CpaF